MRGASRLGGVSVVFTIQPYAAPYFWSDRKFRERARYLRSTGHRLIPISYLGPRNRVVAYAVECVHEPAMAGEGA